MIDNTSKGAGDTDKQPTSLSGDAQPGAYISEEAHIKKEESGQELQKELDRLEKTDDGSDTHHSDELSGALNSTPTTQPTPTPPEPSVDSASNVASKVSADVQTPPVQSNNSVQTPPSTVQGATPTQAPSFQGNNMTKNNHKSSKMKMMVGLGAVFTLCVVGIVVYYLV